MNFHKNIHDYKQSENVWVKYKTHVYKTLEVWNVYMKGTTHIIKDTS